MKNSILIIIFILILIIGAISFYLYIYANQPPKSDTCQNLCGDGICQEVVCEAIGCPCPETPESCPQDCQRPLSTIDFKKQYIFLDQHTNINGKTISGECPMMMIDFPTYSFKKETGILNGMINFEVNEKLKVVYGWGTSLSGDAGGGAGTTLVGIYEFPYNGEDIVINKIDNDGTVQFTYKGKAITLKPNSEWEDIKTETNKETKGCIREDTITDKIINYGILDKTKIKSF